MNVLSLFDGMACGLQALKQAGIKVDNYYASEVDKYATQIAKKNHSEIIHLGDVTQWASWDLPNIDLVIGGSPCQGFSFAGKQKGASTTCEIEITTLEQYLELKNNGFEFNGQSYLFWEYVHALKTLKPKHFLLENVKMSKKWIKVLSDALGVEPVLIDSSLVSGQNRKRLYWGNFDILQPDDKEIYLKDILESGVTDREKSYCLDASYFKGGNLKQYFEKSRRQLVFLDDKKTLSFLLKKRGTLAFEKANNQLRGVDQKSNCLTTSGQNFSNSGSTNLMYKFDGKVGFRPLNPTECERLQTLPDNYTEGLSNTQRYKALGNGWTVSVIEHIFKSMPCNSHK